MIAHPVPVFYPKKQKTPPKSAPLSMIFSFMRLLFCIISLSGNPGEGNSSFHLLERQSDSACSAVSTENAAFPCPFPGESASFRTCGWFTTPDACVSLHQVNCRQILFSRPLLFRRLYSIRHSDTGSVREPPQAPAVPRPASRRGSPGNQTGSRKNPLNIR